MYTYIISAIDFIYRNGERNIEREKERDQLIFASTKASFRAIFSFSRTCSKVLSS